MDTRLIRAASLVGLILGLAASERVGAQSGQISGIVVAERTSEDGARSLLIHPPESLAGQDLDEIRIALSKKTARECSTAHLPAGWTATNEGKELVASGPAAEASAIYIRFTVGPARLPPRPNVSFASGGRDVLRDRFTLTPLPQRQAKPDVRDGREHAPAHGPRYSTALANPLSAS